MRCLGRSATSLCGELRMREANGLASRSLCVGVVAGSGNDHSRALAGTPVQCRPPSLVRKISAEVAAQPWRASVKVTSITPDPAWPTCVPARLVGLQVRPSSVLAYSGPRAIASHPIGPLVGAERARL